MIRWIRANATSILFALIVLIAAVPRIGWPGLTEFKFDEAQMYRSAVRLLRDGVIPSHVLSSIPGIPYPPLMVYVLSLPLLIVRHPAAAVIFIGLLSIGAAALTYFFGARYHSRPVGLIAATLFAAAPWAIFYSRKIWAQNIPLLTLVLMFGLYAFVIERRWWGIFAAVGSTILLVGMHLGNLIFVPIVLSALALHPHSILAAFRSASRRERLIPLIAAAVIVAGLLILMIPWIQLMGVENLTGRIRGLGGRLGSSPFLGSVRSLALIATGGEFGALAGDRLSDYQTRLPLSGAIAVIGQGMIRVITVGILYVIARALWITVRRLIRHEPASRESDASYTLLALWLIIPPIVWTLSGLPPQLHRYIAAYPAQLLALAMLLVDGVNWLAAWKDSLRVPAYGLIGAALVFVMVSQLASYTALMSLIAEGGVNNGHGPPARLIWNAASEARSIAARQGLPITVNSDGDNPDQDGDAAAFDALLGDLSPRLVAGDTVKVRSPEGIIQVNARGGEYRVSLRDPLTTDAAAPTTRLANGIELLRVEPSGIGKQIAPGANVPYSVVWRVWGIPPAPDDYSYSVQLFDAGWLRRVNINDHFLRTRYWHEGDFVITSGMLRLPNDLPAEGPYHLVLTLYVVLPDGSVQPVTVMDAAMNPAGEFIDLPLP